ncbi:hypothetical protein FOCG_03092 [Fusarium oxysporum f. sp. radicis-lycopersici 26381]|uniref:Uncharacterized protein n=1 Tax=Fusarium oxysporum Fo47 TaxID=660027 RepID=W9KFH0_FUSOX|nr:hypothetical protein FOZG_06754 [Fusarium oxysporum Fo47]EXL60117.1 hypothetical protein FOCG_03092 [Fusarium oxysporum f. sp. radicis-lycopersici 26381]
MNLSLPKRNCDSQHCGFFGSELTASRRFLETRLRGKDQGAKQSVADDKRLGRLGTRSADLLLQRNLEQYEKRIRNLQHSLPNGEKERAANKEAKDPGNFLAATNTPIH